MPSILGTFKSTNNNNSNHSPAEGGRAGESPDNNSFSFGQQSSSFRAVANDDTPIPQVKTSVKSIVISVLGSEARAADRLSSKKRKKVRESAVGINRLLLVILAFLKLILTVIAFIVANQSTTEAVLINAFRLAYLAVVAGLNFSSPIFLMKKDVYYGVMAQLTISLGTLVLEMCMFSLVEETSSVFILGLISVLVTVVQLVIVLFALKALLKIAPEDQTEEFYTNFASPQFYSSRIDRREELLLACEELLEGQDPPEDEHSCRLLVGRAIKLLSSREEQQDEVDIAMGKVTQPSQRQEGSTNLPVGSPLGAGQSGRMQTLSPGLELESIGGSGMDFNPVNPAGAMVQAVQAPVAAAAAAASDAAGEAVKRVSSKLTRSSSFRQGGTWGQWHAANRIRSLLYERDNQSYRMVLIFMLVVTFFCLGNIIFEFLKIFTNQPPILSTDLTNQFNELDLRTSYFPERSHSSWKVHLIVMDGLRDDMMESGASALGDYIHSSEFEPYSLRMKARAQIPSFSVPNWMSILTGAQPEMHGVTGNLGNTETSFDHMFREAKDYGLHTGMTGTPWWKSLVFSTLPPLDGDGTVSFDFNNGSVAYDWITANPADEERLSVALRAARRSTVTNPFGPGDVTNLYDLFLTHFSDIDTQGHEYGVDVEWNERDTYMKAIVNKTEALKSIVSTVDTNTVVIVTSDHGHVKRGGHGGVTDVLKAIPLIFYVKGKVMNTTAFPAQDFTADSMPRSNAGGNYQNLDISGTICALLGIPIPRQTQGIFVEEALQALLPDTDTIATHFHDLYMAKRASLAIYAELLKDGLFSDKTSDPLLTTDLFTSTFNTTSQQSNAEYAKAIRAIDQLHLDMRDQQATYAWTRNLLCSLIVFFPLLACVTYLYGARTQLRFYALGKSTAIARAVIAGFVTMFLYLAASIVIFLIGYFAVIGYTVWDSTLTHTTSAAQPFIQGTIVGPVVVYLILTKLYLLPLIEWRVSLIPEEAAEGVDLTAVLRWSAYFLKDLVTLCLGTRNYKAERFGDAYLYILSLTFWTFVASLLLSTLLFPFTFMVPVVLSTQYFSDINLEWRFRMITVLMMMLPMQFGCCLLLALRPKFTRENLYLWDNCFVNVQMATQYEMMKEQLNAAINAQSSMDSSVVSAKVTRLADRIQLMKQTIELLVNPENRTHHEDLHHNGYNQHIGSS